MEIIADHVALDHKYCKAEAMLWFSFYSNSGSVPRPRTPDEANYVTDQGGQCNDLSQETHTGNNIQNKSEDRKKL